MVLEKRWWLASLVIMWWKLLIPMVLFSAGHAAKEPAFLVTFPAVIPAASRATFCVHLLYPNETLRTSVFLDDDSGSTTLLTSVTKKPVFDCFRFQSAHRQRRCAVILHGHGEAVLLLALAVRRRRPGDHLASDAVHAESQVLVAASDVVEEHGIGTDVAVSGNHMQDRRAASYVLEANTVSLESVILSPRRLHGFLPRTS
ncbi:pregnancy zone protein-like [Arapaima gigas]